jgi:hypothetical protein
MIIKLHNWIYFFTMIMTMIEGNYFNSFSAFIVSFYESEKNCVIGVL